MSGLVRTPNTGDAILFTGDPRLAVQKIDGWFRELLTEERPAYKRKNIYGADAGLCARRNVLLAHNDAVSTRTSASSQAYFAIGLALEGMLAKGLADAGRLVSAQLVLPLFPEVRVNGKIDLVIIDHEDELALVEVKTCGKLPDEPKVTHLAQVEMYAAVTGITKTWLTYISRNVEEAGEWGTLAIRSFLVSPSQEQQESRLTTAIVSGDAIKQGRAPTVPPTFRKHTECHYCEFRDLFCWKPRPGLGGDVQPLPLPEMSFAEQMVLVDRARIEAKRLVLDAPFRKLKVMQQLKREVDSPPLKEKVQGFIDELVAELSAPAPAKGGKG